MATTNSTSYPLTVPQPRVSVCELAELGLSFAAILAVLWMPTHQQLIFGPSALLAPLVLVVMRRPSLDDLGLGLRGFLASLWILPAAVGLSVISILVAQDVGTFHRLYQPDVAHVGGYVLWTLYQQFLLQDYFMSRLSRMLSSAAAHQRRVRVVPEIRVSARDPAAGRAFDLASRNDAVDAPR